MPADSQAEARTTSRRRPGQKSEAVTAKRQRWNADRYARHARFVSDLGLPVIDLLAPEPGERILDLGCGDGALTIRLLERGCEVIGIDASADMVAAARERGINALVGDAHALEYDGEFDAIFSNAALHWMDEPQQVIHSVRRALKPGGRFVGEFGGEGNVAAVMTGVRKVLRRRGLPVVEPWFFPGPAEYSQLLSAEGLRVDSIDLFRRPTPLPGDIRAWLETFWQPYMTPLPERSREDFIEEVRSELRSSLRDADGCWHIDYVRLRFRSVWAAE